MLSLDYSRYKYSKYNGTMSRKSLSNNYNKKEDPYYRNSGSNRRDYVSSGKAVRVVRISTRHTIKT